MPRTASTFREETDDSLKLACRRRGGDRLLLAPARPPPSRPFARRRHGRAASHLEQFAQGFSKQADALTAGKVKFQIFPAGTIGSPLKITESVQKKVAQAGHSWPGYDWGIDKAAAIFGGYVGSPPAEALLHWVYAAGGIELWREWRMEKFGVVGIPCGAHSDEIHMHSQEARPHARGSQGPEAQDLGRLGRGCHHARRLDRHPAGRARSIRRSSAASSTRSNGRRPGINLGLGFHKVAKYIILPGVHQPGAVLECIFDKALWDSFDATTKTQIEAAAKQATLKSWMTINMMDADALEKLKAAGVGDHPRRPVLHRRRRQGDQGWEDKYIASDGGWFKKVVEHQRAFMTVWKQTNQYRTEFR